LGALESPVAAILARHVRISEEICGSPFARPFAHRAVDEFGVSIGRHQTRAYSAPRRAVATQPPRRQLVRLHHGAAPSSGAPKIAAMPAECGTAARSRSAASFLRPRPAETRTSPEDGRTRGCFSARTAAFGAPVVPLVKEGRMPIASGSIAHSGCTARPDGARRAEKRPRAATTWRHRASVRGPLAIGGTRYGGRDLHEPSASSSAAGQPVVSGNETGKPGHAAVQRPEPHREACSRQKPGEAAPARFLVTGFLCRRAPPRRRATRYVKRSSAVWVEIRSPNPSVDQWRAHSIRFLGRDGLRRRDAVQIGRRGGVFWLP